MSSIGITHGATTELDAAAAALQAARERLARAAVGELLTILKRKGAGTFDEKAADRATENITDILLAEDLV